MSRSDQTDLIFDPEPAKQPAESACLISAHAIQCRAFVDAVGSRWQYSSTEGAGPIALEWTNDWARHVPFIAIGCGQPNYGIPSPGRHRRLPLCGQRL